MNHISIRKYLALICILVSALMLVCACTPSGDNGNGTTNNETVSDFGTDPDNTEDTTAAPTDTATYKITVLDPNGAPFQNAFITCNEDPSVFARTDANGTASITAKASYTLKISAGVYGETTLPLTADTTELTVNLAPVDDGKVEYTVKVMDSHGNGIEGVKVQLCVGDLCQLPVHTDANGVATIRAEEDSYTVKISKDGYVSEDAYMFSMGSHELKVILSELE